MLNLPLLNKSNRYCLLIVGREDATQSIFDITPEKEIKEIQSVKNVPLGDLVSRLGRPSGRSIGIVGLHPSIAYSISLPLKIERNELHSPHLTGPEVENLLTREVSQRFIQLLSEASEALGIDQVDTILADSRVGNFKVNGRRVLQPVGCEAKEFEATTELTFTSRKLYEEVKKYFSHPRFFMGDSGRAVLQALAREGEPPFGLLALDHPQSVYVRLEKVSGKRIAFKRAIVPWSSKIFTETLVSTWSLDSGSAEKVWQSFCDNELPSKGQQFIEDKFKKNLQPLEKIIKKIPRRGESFLASSSHIPENLFDSDKLSSPSPLLIERLEKMGFVFDKGSEPHFMGSPLILGIIEDYFSDRGHTDINRWLRRRLHWLGSVEYN